jgi:hypothetical protein
MSTITGVAGPTVMGPSSTPNLQAVLAKAQDDVDFYSLMAAMGQSVSDASGNPLGWSDNRIHNLSPENCFGIKFAPGYEPAGQNLVFSGTLTSDQIAAVNAGKTIGIGSSGGDTVLHLDANTGKVTATPSQRSNTDALVAAATTDPEPGRPVVNVPRTYLGELFHNGTGRSASRMKV